MIDLAHEQLVTLADVPGLPIWPQGKAPSYLAVWRWARRRPNGPRLEVVKLGRSLYTSIEALGRFGTASAEVPEHEPEAMKTRRPRARDKRRKDIERARAALREELSTA